MIPLDWFGPRRESAMDQAEDEGLALSMRAAGYDQATIAAKIARRRRARVKSYPIAIVLVYAIIELDRA